MTCGYGDLFWCDCFLCGRLVPKRRAVLDLQVAGEGLPGRDLGGVNLGVVGQVCVCRRAGEEARKVESDERAVVVERRDDFGGGGGGRICDAREAIGREVVAVKLDRAIAVATRDVAACGEGYARAVAADRRVERHIRYARAETGELTYDTIAAVVESDLRGNP